MIFTERKNNSLKIQTELALKYDHTHQIDLWTSFVPFSLKIKENMKIVALEKISYEYGLVYKRSEKFIHSIYGIQK